MNESTNNEIPCSVRFNIPQPAVNSRLTWLGKERDAESGLGDHGVRKYDNQGGRFTAPDPLYEKYINWTPYQYAMNNPVSFVDVNGKELKVIGNQELGKKDLNLLVGQDNASRLTITDNGDVSVNTEGYTTGSSAGLDLLITIDGSDKKFGYEAFNSVPSLTPNNTGDIVNKTTMSYYEDIDCCHAYENPPVGYDGYVALKTTVKYFDSEQDKNANTNEIRGRVVGHELQENYYRAVDRDYYPQAHSKSNEKFFGGVDGGPYIYKKP